MKPFQQRVVTERDELAEKLTSLDSFIGGEIFKVIPAEEKIRLAKQAGVMKEYLDILNDRINAFPPPSLTIVP
jgi:hypothetical protein